MKKELEALEKLVKLAQEDRWRDGSVVGTNIEHLMEENKALFFRLETLEKIVGDMFNEVRSLKTRVFPVKQCENRIGSYEINRACKSQAFNLHKEGIDQGDYCDACYFEHVKEAVSALKRRQK